MKMIMPACLYEGGLNESIMVWSVIFSTHAAQLAPKKRPGKLISLFDDLDQMKVLRRKVALEIHQSKIIL